MEVKKIAFFDTKPYDKESFERQTTLKNLDDYFAGAPLENEICYRCLGSGGAKKGDCPHRANGRCHSVT